MKIPLDNLYCILHSMCCTVYGTQYMTLDASIYDNLRSELRRGSLILAVLGQLRTEQYGYTLRKALADHGMDIEESTLYPLLRRLETQGLLRSEWREEDKRNKRFYVLSADGQEVLEKLLAEWRNLDSSLSEIVGGKEHATR